MANRFTRVPDRPVPLLPGWARAAIPVADLFMLLMVSRPSSGSLSRTWVTPATFRMCVAVVALCAVCAALAAGGLVGRGPAVVGIGALLAVIAVGAAAVALVGLAQHRA